MEGLNEQDCFASFGSLHYRKKKALSISSNTTRPETANKASTSSSSSHRRSLLSSASGPTSSKATSISAEDVGPPKANQTVQAPQLQAQAADADYEAPPKTPGLPPLRPLDWSANTYQSRQLRPTALPTTAACNELFSNIEPGGGLRDLMSQTKHLLGSCCLVDARTAETPVVYSTDEQIRRHISFVTARHEEPECISSNGYLLQVIERAGQKSLFLVVNRAVKHMDSLTTTYRMTARVDVTGLLPDRQSLQEEVDDIWLSVAADEMWADVASGRALQNQRKHIPLADFLRISEGLVDSLQRISALYDMFFVIKPAAVHSGYEASFVSAGPAGTADGAAQQQKHMAKQTQLARIVAAVNAGEYKLAKLLAQGYRFVFDARGHLADKHEIVWCLPMDGQGWGRCWVCFVLESVA